MKFKSQHLQFIHKHTHNIECIQLIYILEGERRRPNIDYRSPHLSTSYRYMHAWKPQNTILQ